LQRKAVQEGLPHQTYVSSIIHKFVSGNMPLFGFGTFSVPEKRPEREEAPRPVKRSR
jgi:hypothetical protein